MRSIFLFLAVLTGCTTTTGALKTGANAYTVTATATIASGGAISAKKAAYIDASGECGKAGKAVEVVAEKATPPSWTDGMHTMELSFKCV